ncbi:hypothetical protein V8C35DRAFT_214123 [Trichoderma chlorosporum]
MLPRRPLACLSLPCSSFPSFSSSSFLLVSCLLSSFLSWPISLAAPFAAVIFDLTDQCPRNEPRPMYLHELSTHWCHPNVKCPVRAANRLPDANALVFLPLPFTPWRRLVAHRRKAAAKQAIAHQLASRAMAWTSNIRAPDAVPRAAERAERATTAALEPSPSSPPPGFILAMAPEKPVSSSQLRARRVDRAATGPATGGGVGRPAPFLSTQSVLCEHVHTSVRSFAGMGMGEIWRRVEERAPSTRQVLTRAVRRLPAGRGAGACSGFL